MWIIRHNTVEEYGQIVAEFTILGPATSEEMIEAYKRDAEAAAKKACEQLGIRAGKYQVLVKTMPMRADEHEHYVLAKPEEEAEFVATSVGWKLLITDVDRRRLSEKEEQTKQ